MDSGYPELPPRFRSVGWRFSSALIGIVTLLLLVFAILAIVLNIRSLQSALEAKLQNVLNLSTVSLRTSLWNIDNHAISDFIESLFLDPDVVYARVFIDDEAIVTKVREAVRPQVFDAFVRDTNFLAQAAEIIYEGSRVGTIQLAVSRVGIRQELGLNIASIVLLTAVVIGAIAITSWLVSRRYVARPLGALQQSATSIAGGELDTRIDASSPDEIGLLARDLNTMRESIRRLFGALSNSKEQLEESNRMLEVRVDERTRELQDKNAQLEETLIKLQAMQNQIITQEKMVALGGLVAGVAHEINTPVGIGVTAASMLQERTTAFQEAYKIGNMKRSDLEKYLDTANQSSTMLLANLNRAADLIQSFKKVAVDQSTEGRRVFSIRTYIDEILLSLRPKLKRTQHHIDVHVDGELELDSDPGAFSQIVTNLVMNSLTHAYEPADQGHMVFDFALRDDRLIFIYSDDGQGIPPENLDKIFEPFYTTKRGQGGSGLGLHIIYNLVTQKLGGTIRCESDIGVGARFIIELPM